MKIRTPYSPLALFAWQRDDAVLGPILRRRQEREEDRLSASNEAYEVGYGRPPKETRWKKGQSGNAGRKNRRPASVGTVEIIDRLFGEPIEIVETALSAR